MEQTQEQYTSEKLFPKHKSGPMKGKLIHQLDERGNIVIDPTANIKKDPLFIDYNLFTKEKALAEKGRKKSSIVISKQQRETIRSLFQFKTKKDSEGQLTDLQKFLKKKSIQRKMIKVQREGEAAGAKDTQVIGP